MSEINTTSPSAVTPSGSNGLATTALILGIIGVILSWIPIVNVVGLILDITAVILGAIGMVKAKKSGKGKAVAIIGIILGVIGIGMFIYIAFVVAAAVNTINNYQIPQ